MVFTFSKLRETERERGDNMEVSKWDIPYSAYISQVFNL